MTDSHRLKVETVECRPQSKDPLKMIADPQLYAVNRTTQDDKRCTKQSIYPKKMTTNPLQNPQSTDLLYKL